MENRTRKVSLLEMPALTALISATPVIEYTTGDSLFQYGEPCTSLPLVISGNARIYVRGNAGRQVTLYRLKPGNVCPISLSTLMLQSIYPATASAETAAQVRYLAGEQLHTVVRETPGAFSIFLETFAGCLYDLVSTARELMFDPLDVRLAHLLREQFSGSPNQSINVTHEEIAHELGTTRVVASRLLKRLENTNCIQLCRKKIILNDVDILNKLTGVSKQANSPA